MSKVIDLKRKATITGLGYYVPPKIVTNDDWAKIVDTSDEWITTRTGINQRRMAEPGVASSDLGAKAAEKALRNANLLPSEVDLIIVGTISPDMIFPSTSCIIQEKIGALNAAAFDVSAACSAFPYLLTIASQFVENGLYKNVLVIASEALTHLVDKEDRATCVLFGDGAGAAVVSLNNEDSGILSSFLGADGACVDLLKLPAGGSKLPATQETVENRLHYLKMAGGDVFKIAVRKMVGAAKGALESAGVLQEDVECLIPHQANLRIIDAVSNRLDIPNEKVFVNVDRYGNMSGASTIVGLCEVVEQGVVSKGSIIVIVAFGAGFTWGANVIKW